MVLISPARAGGKEAAGLKINIDAQLPAAPWHHAQRIVVAILESARFLRPAAEVIPVFAVGEVVDTAVHLHLLRHLPPGAQVDNPCMSSSPPNSMSLMCYFFVSSTM